MSRQTEFDAIVIGAGFFGLRIAQHLREHGLAKVLVLEAEAEPMTRASYGNQARVHNGYHYPRSILTGFRSRVSSEQFIAEYAPAISKDFEHIYAISTNLSKTNAKQFEIYCDRIGANLHKSPVEVERQFSDRNIEKSWVAEEFAFDSHKLRTLVLEKIDILGGIQILFQTQALRIHQGVSGLTLQAGGGQNFESPLVISSIYSAINKFHEASGLPLLPLQHELTELSLVSVPKFWTRRGLTVMDGPFFSFMPFPSTGLHSLSHVRYTPLIRWEEKNGQTSRKQKLAQINKLPSTFPEMKKDLCRYVHDMEGLEYVTSIREVKTVLARNDLSDSRPILVRDDFGLEGYITVLGSKIDNVNDVLDELVERLDLQRSRTNENE